MFLANSSPTSNEWNVPPLCSHYQNNSTLSPGLLGWRLNYLAILLHDWRRFSHIAKCFQIWSTVVGSVMNNAWDFSPSPPLSTIPWNAVPLCKLPVRNKKQSTFDVLQNRRRGPDWFFSKYSLFDDRVSTILSTVVVERFTLDNLLEVKVAKEKS